MIKVTNPMQLCSNEPGKDILCPNCGSSIIPPHGAVPIPGQQDIIHCACGYDLSDTLRSLTEPFICQECGAKLSEDDEYHVKYGTCNSYCYGKMVGVYY